MATNCPFLSQFRRVSVETPKYLAASLIVIYRVITLLCIRLLYQSNEYAII